VIGGVGYSPKFLRSQIHELKEGLKDKNGAFGVDLLIPRTRSPFDLPSSLPSARLVSFHTLPCSSFHSPLQHRLVPAR
jgi:hypothetical protein